MVRFQPSFSFWPRPLFLGESRDGFAAWIIDRETSPNDKRDAERGRDSEDHRQSPRTERQDDRTVNRDGYRSRAVRALVLLHDEHLRRFLVVWKQAKGASIALPQTADPAYASLDTLLSHVLRAARGYMIWMCEVLELPDPEIRVPSEAAVLSAEADNYMEHVLERWRTPLLDVGDEKLETPEYPSRWQTRYCIDAMLEHAVMHPIRHAFQLEELMRAAPGAQNV
jgi:hypothetical protein